MATLDQLCDSAEELAKDLVDESIQQTCISHHEWDSYLEDEMHELADDEVINKDDEHTVYEYWGTRSDGEPWRVHLTLYTDE